MKRPPNAVPMSPATYAATVATLEAGGVPQSDPACPGCAVKAREIARLKKKLLGQQGMIDRIAELRGGKGSD